MKYTHKPASIFPNVLLQSMKYCIFLPLHIDIKFLMCFKRHQSVPIVFLTSLCGCIRHVVFICSSHRDTFFQFTISQWFLSLRSVLSVCHTSIKHFWWKWVTFFPARNCYELPSSGSGVTSFPVKTLNCHISQTRHTRIPSFALNWNIVSSILCTKNRAISSPGALRVWPLFVSFDPAVAARGRR